MKGTFFMEDYGGPGTGRFFLPEIFRIAISLLFFA
jgi:hypothetical protein